MRTLTLVISFLFSSSLYPVTEGEESSSESAEEYVMIPGTVMMVNEESDNLEPVDLSQVSAQVLLQEIMHRLNSANKRAVPHLKTHEQKKSRAAFYRCLKSKKASVFLCAGLSTVGADTINYWRTGELVPAYFIIAGISISTLHAILSYYNVYGRIWSCFYRKPQTTDQNNSDGPIRHL